MLPGGYFPTVVCEAGLSEKHPELMGDGRLWLLDTESKTKIVIVIAFTQSCDGPRVENCKLEVDARGNLGTREEQMVLDSIDSTTGFHDLSAKLVDLNR